MTTTNPFEKLDHVVEESPDLKDRVLRSAERRRGLLALAGLFTGDYLKTLLGLAGGRPEPEGPSDTKTT